MRWEAGAEESQLSLQLKPRVTTRAKISSVGTYVPPRVLTNADMERMVDTNDQWIMERTGIRERHVVDAGMATSDMAVEAAKSCLEKRGIDPSEIDCIIVGTVTPDMVFPATACLVQTKLGASKAWGFDLSAACSAFTYALQVGAQFIQSGAHTKVLVIGADTMSSIVDYTDRTTCILFGDGAGCVLLEPCEEGEIGLVDFYHEVDGSGGSALCMPAGGSLHPARAETVAAHQHFIKQEGQTVYKFAVRKMMEASERVLQANGVLGSELAAFIPHQANKRIILATAERLGLSEDRVIINIDRYGNTTGGTIPLAMGTALEEKRLKKGDLVLLASVGAGFTVGATLLRWEF
jgi:3-oxoacyl-[acyl-carrier-protein] synthase-3